MLSNIFLSVQIHQQQKIKQMNCCFSLFNKYMKRCDMRVCNMISISFVQYVNFPLSDRRFFRTMKHKEKFSSWIPKTHQTRMYMCLCAYSYTRIVRITICVCTYLRTRMCVYSYAYVHMIIHVCENSEVIKVHLTPKNFFRSIESTHYSKHLGAKIFEFAWILDFLCPLKVALEVLHDRVLGSLGRRLLMTSTQEPNTMTSQSALYICSRKWKAKLVVPIYFGTKTSEF